MTVASAQAQQFYQQLAAEQRVFTFLDEDSFLVFRVDNVEVVPFWSTATRLDRVKATHAKYRHYQCDEISLEKFLATTLPQLKEEAIHIGINWAGDRLTGFDISADDVVKNLNYWLSQQKA